MTSPTIATTLMLQSDMALPEATALQILTVAVLFTVTSLALIGACWIAYRGSGGSYLAGAAPIIALGLIGVLVKTSS